MSFRLRVSGWHCVPAKPQAGEPYARQFGKNWKILQDFRVDTPISPGQNKHVASKYVNGSLQKWAGCTVLVEERRQKILDLVSERGYISLAELAKSIGASESTLRRDLDYWDQQGFIR